MTIVLSLRYMTVVTVTLLLSILLSTFAEALTLRHPTKLFSSRSTRICTTTLHLKKKEGINKEFDNENKKSEYVNSVVGIDRGTYLLLIPAIISKFKIKSVQIQFIAIFLLTQYTNDRCFHFFFLRFRTLFSFCCLVNLWFFTIPTEFRRSRLCSAEETANFPTKCMTTEQFKTRISDYYKNGTDGTSSCTRLFICVFWSLSHCLYQSNIVIRFILYTTFIRKLYSMNYHTTTYLMVAT